MNATPPVLPAFIPDAGAAAAAASASAPVKSNGGSSFAGALKEVGARAGRKPVTSKAGSGESLPPAGNSAPPTPQPVAPHSAAPTTTAAASSPDNETVTAPDDPPGTTTAVSGATHPVGESIASAPSTASRVPETTSPTEPPAGQVTSSLPVGVAVTAAKPSEPSVALQQAPPAAPVDSTPAAAVAGGAGKASGTAAPSRPSFKAALQHPVGVSNPPDDSGDNDAGTEAASTNSSSNSAASAVAPGAAAIDISTVAPPTDTSEAAVLAAMAGSRAAYSAAANTVANDSGATALSASAVAGASLTDASLQVSAASAPAAASVAQATALEGLMRTDRHSSATLDASLSTSGAEVAAGLSQLGASAGSTPVDATATPTLRVAANVDSTNFSQDLSARVSWMVDNNINGAKLQVNPPQLGPIELRILVSGDHAQVWMSTHSAVTRDALESSTPKLREMLGTQGFSQVSVDISQRSFQERSSYSQPYEQASTADRRGAGAEAPVASSETPRNSLGVLDAYA